jgi:GLPGLI family protein
MKTFLDNFGLCMFVNLVFFNLSLFGQIERLHYIDDFILLDSARYEITYKVVNIEKPDDKETDIQKLLIGRNLSKYFSYLLFQNDSVCTIIEKQGRDMPSEPRGAENYEVFKNYQTGKQSILERVDGTFFRYEEDKLFFNWVIQSDRKMIMTYLCQKVSTEFRGRKYEAWFTTSIPIPEGPYKFGGLPGLILELMDDQQHFVFTCIGIKTHTPPLPIKNRNWPYTKTTRKKFHEFLESKHRNPTAYYKSRGVTFATKIDGKIVFNPNNYYLPYNPIELE